MTTYDGQTAYKQLFDIITKAMDNAISFDDHIHAPQWQAFLRVTGIPDDALYNATGEAHAIHSDADRNFVKLSGAAQTDHNRILPSPRLAHYLLHYAVQHPDISAQSCDALHAFFVATLPHAGLHITTNGREQRDITPYTYPAIPSMQTLPAKPKPVTQWEPKQAPPDARLTDVATADNGHPAQTSTPLKDMPFQTYVEGQLRASGILGTHRGRENTISRNSIASMFPEPGERIRALGMPPKLRQYINGKMPGSGEPTDDLRWFLEETAQRSNTAFDDREFDDVYKRSQQQLRATSAIDDLVSDQPQGSLGHYILSLMGQHGIGDHQFLKTHRGSVATNISTCFQYLKDAVKQDSLDIDSNTIWIFTKKLSQYRSNKQLPNDDHKTLLEMLLKAAAPDNYSQEACDEAYAYTEALLNDKPDKDVLDTVGDEDKLGETNNREAGS